MSSSDSKQSVAAPAAAAGASAPSAAAAAPALTSAAVLGATGVVGQQVVRALLELPSVQKIVIVGRRPFDVRASRPPVACPSSLIPAPPPPPSLHIPPRPPPPPPPPPQDPVAKADSRVTQVTLGALTVGKVHSPAVVKELQGLDAAFITMGLGQPSKHSKEELYDADVEFPAAFVDAAEEAKVRHVGLLSSTGADPGATSWFNMTGAGMGLYSRYKATIENHLRNAGFPSASVYRAGAITENPNTGSMNWLFPKIEFMMPAGFKSTTATDLARAMVYGAVQALQGKAEPSGFNEAELQAEFDKNADRVAIASHDKPDLATRNAPVAKPAGHKPDLKAVFTYDVPVIHRIVATIATVNPFTAKPPILAAPAAAVPAAAAAPASSGAAAAAAGNPAAVAAPAAAAAAPAASS